MNAFSPRNAAATLGAATLALSTAVVLGCLVWWPDAWLVGLVGLMATVVVSMRLASLLTTQHILSTLRKRQLSAEAVSRQQGIEARERRRRFSAEDAEDFLQSRRKRDW